MKDKNAKSSVYVSDYYGWGGGFFADQVHETEKDEYSKLLGPDGNPLKYSRPKMGFDLTPRTRVK